MASSESLSESSSTSATPMEGVEKVPSTQDGEAFPQAQADDTSMIDEIAKMPKKDVVMCVALTAHSRHKSKET